MDPRDLCEWCLENTRARLCEDCGFNLCLDCAVDCWLPGSHWFCPPCSDHYPLHVLPPPPLEEEEEETLEEDPVVEPDPEPEPEPEPEGGSDCKRRRLQ